MNNKFKSIGNLFNHLFKLNIDELFYAISWRSNDRFFNYMHAVLLRTDQPKVRTRELNGYFQRFATIDDGNLFLKTGISKNLLKERLDNGDRCYILGQDDKILTQIWGSPGKRYLKLGGSILDPGDKGVIFYGGASDKSVRLKGLFPVAINKLNQSFKNINKNVVYAAVNSLNKYSIMVHKRMNFKLVGESYHLSLFGIKITYYQYWPHPTRKLHIFIKTPPEGLYWN